MPDSRNVSRNCWLWLIEICNLCDLSEEHAGIDNLTAQIDEGSHKRIFKIVRGNGGKSYASDIAQAFGLTKDEIVKNAKAARTAENA